MALKTKYLQSELQLREIAKEILQRQSPGNMTTKSLDNKSLGDKIQTLNQHQSLV